MLRSFAQGHVGKPAPRAMECQAATRQLVDQNLNPRVAQVQPSTTMAFTDKARAKKEAGHPVIALAAGEPDFDTPAAIVEAGVEALRGGKTRYTPNVGTSQLLAAIVKKLKDENGLEYSPSDIVVSNGAKQSIWQAVFATCSPGDEVLIPAPFWVSYPEMVRLAGAKPVVVPTSAGSGYRLTPALLRAHLSPRTRMLMFSTPCNPSGITYTREQLQGLADVIKEHERLLVLSDEIYEHIIYPPAEHVSFAALPGMFERTFTVNGFSKAFAMTGWRLGYLAAPPPFAKATARIQSQTTSGANSIAQHAALAALALGHAGGEPVARMRAEFEKRRDYVYQQLRAMPGVTIEAPTGAFYAFPDVSGVVGAGVSAAGYGDITSSDDLAMYLLDEWDLALVPGSAFGSPECIRISYAASMEDLREAMERMGKALDALKK